MESKKILLIEDEDAMRDLYTEVLSDANYTVVSAPDGNSGLKMALDENWDLLLLDIMLPGQDGLHILKYIKENDRLRDRPIILLTNLSSEPIINEAFDLGAESYIVKSDITPDKMVNEVNSFLNVADASSE
jgi:DNA-binding response OmpR family regulator